MFVHSIIMVYRDHLLGRKMVTMNPITSQTNLLVANITILLSTLNCPRSVDGKFVLKKVMWAAVIVKL